MRTRRLVVFGLILAFVVPGCAAIRKRMIKKALKERTIEVAKRTAPMTWALIEGEGLTEEQASVIAPCVEYGRRAVESMSLPCWEDVKIPVSQLATVIDQASDRQLIACSLAIELEAAIRENKPREEMVLFIADMAEADMLRPALEALVNKAQSNSTEEEREVMVETLASTIETELCINGRLRGCQESTFEGWEKFTARLTHALDESGSSHADQRAFLGEMEQVMGVPFTNDNKVKLLASGPVARAARAELATGLGEGDRYYFMSWSVYDDQSGEEFAERMCTLARAGVDVRGIVDGGTAKRRKKNLEIMEDCGVNLVKYEFKASGARAGHTQHVKVEIRNGAEMILDSRNIGDHYMHYGDPDGYWDDYGARLCGGAVQQAESFFAQVWNDYLEQHPKKSYKLGGHIEVQPPGAACVGTQWDAVNVKAAAVGQRSGADDASILLGKMKMIRGARPGQVVDIQNAYVIKYAGDTDGILKQEINAAAARGVRFRIHTNSVDSIDKEGGKLVMPPILRTVKELKEAHPDQIEVYLEPGPRTLHSKVDRVGDITDFGSDNYHPRGALYEHELNLFVADRTIAGMVKREFERDIARSTHVPTADQIKVPNNIVSRLVNEFIRNQL